MLDAAASDHQILHVSAIAAPEELLKFSSATHQRRAERHDCQGTRLRSAALQLEQTVAEDPRLDAADGQIVQHAAASPETMNASINHGEQSIHLVVSRRRGVVEAGRPALLLDIDAVQHERVEVDVQVELGAEGDAAGSGPIDGRAQRETSSTGCAPRSSGSRSGPCW